MKNDGRCENNRQKRKRSQKTESESESRYESRSESESIRWSYSKTEKTINDLVYKQEKYKIRNSILYYWSITRRTAQHFLSIKHVHTSELER